MVASVLHRACLASLFVTLTPASLRTTSVRAASPHCTPAFLAAAPARHCDGVCYVGGSAAAAGGVDKLSRVLFEDGVSKSRPPPHHQRQQRREATAAAAAAVDGGHSNFGRQQRLHQPSRLTWAKVRWTPRRRTTRLPTAPGVAHQTTQIISSAQVHWTPRRQLSWSGQLQQQQSPRPERASRLTTAATYDGSNTTSRQRQRTAPLTSWAKVHWTPHRDLSWSGRQSAAAAPRERTARLTTWSKGQWSPDQPTRAAAAAAASRDWRGTSMRLNGEAGVRGVGRVAAAAGAGGGVLTQLAFKPPPAEATRTAAVVSTPSLGGGRRFDPPVFREPSMPSPTARSAVAAATVGSTGPRDLSGAPVEVISTAEKYYQVIRDNAVDDTIVVIKIYAGFCRACKAFDRKFRKLSLDFQEQGANIKFFEMDWMQTRDLCKSLQKKVKKLPHMELYVGERGRLESFVCGPSKSSLLKEKLDKLITDPLDPSFGEAPIPDEETITPPPARADSVEM